MLFRLNYLTIFVSLLLCFVQGGLCFYPRGWKEKRPVVIMLLISVALTVAAFVEGCSDRHRWNERALSDRIIATDLTLHYLVSAGQIAYMLVIKKKRRRERARLHTDDPKIYKARKEFIEKVEEFNRLSTVGRADIKLRGLDYVDYLRVVCGLARDDRYYLEYRDKAETRYDVMKRDEQVLNAAIVDDEQRRAQHHYHQKDSSGAHRPDAWRSHIPYSDPWDSHIDNNLPDSFDRDGDGYRDGSVGDSGLFDA